MTTRKFTTDTNSVFLRVALGMLVCAVLWGLASPVQAKIYRCKDATGRVITSDRPIPECLDREQSLLGRSGVVRKRLKPKKTENELAQERERQKELAAKAKAEEEERKADRALVGRYPNKKAHDAKRELSLIPLKQTIIMAEQHLKLLEQARVKLDEQLDFYPDKTKMPGGLRSRNEKNLQAIAAQQKLIRAKAREIERINHRYNTELLKLRTLWKQRDGQEQTTEKEPSGKQKQL